MADQLGIGVIGFGWMGQAHSRSFGRIATLFPDRPCDAHLVVCSDPNPDRAKLAVESFEFETATSDWREVVDHPDVDAVCVCAPNALHLEMTLAAAAAGKAVFCEKPVGGTPAQTAQIEKAARDAGVITGVGYNYRWAPLVLYTKQLIADGALGEITNYRGRFFSMYGSDPLGPLTWRYRHEEAGYGATTDILSHAVDLAHMLVGPITELVGTGETFVRNRPLPRESIGSHYERGHADDPTGAVTNEDYAGMLAIFANGARGSFEASRSIVGPQSQMAFELHGTRGAVSWNLETMNQLEVFLLDDADQPAGYTRLYSGDRFPYHGRFVPGDANGIGFEDLIVIEDFEFLRAVHSGVQHEPGFRQALEYVSVQAALLRSWESRAWEPVTSLEIS